MSERVRMNKKGELNLETEDWFPKQTDRQTDRGHDPTRPKRSQTRGSSSHVKEEKSNRGTCTNISDY